MKAHTLPCPRPLLGRSGFALVVTLSLMVLLTLLAVGLLSLSSISLRAASQSQAKAVAQANARLALMLAIGELQNSMGPDQRITAPSGILDSDPDTAAADGVANPHLTGVWNARDAAKESLDSYNTNPPDYSRDKPNFQSWLVSNAKPSDVEQLNFAKDGSCRGLYKTGHRLYKTGHRLFKTGFWKRAAANVWQSSMWR